MDAIFARLNIRARVALCGLISGYNSADPPPGPRAFANLLIQRATLQGFIVLDMWRSCRAWYPMRVRGLTWRWSIQVWAYSAKRDRLGLLLGHPQDRRDPAAQLH